MIVHVFAVSVPLVVAPLGARLLRRGQFAVPFAFSGAVAALSFAFRRGPFAAILVLPFAAVAAALAASEALEVA